METIIFQHLDTINLFSSNDVNLVGRTLKGESVCLRISEIRPHFCIQLDREVNAVAWFDQFKRNVWLYQLSKTATKDDETKDKVPNVARKRENIPKDYLIYEEIDGQDIKNYCEHGPRRFLRIFAKDKWVCKNAKRFLSSTESLNYVHLQYYPGIPTVKDYYLMKTVTKEVHGNDDNISINLKQDLAVFSNRKIYTLYNEQVDFTLQYLIDKGIYSCSFIEAKGTVVKDKEEKLSTCDIEMVNIMTIRQIDVNDMAPWHILSYDIESVPGDIPGRVGKYTFPTPWKDPVCTIGATLQIGQEISQYVWLLNGPNGCADRRSVDTLSALDDPPDEYRPEETTVYSFYSELELLDHFFKFIVIQDVDFIEGHNINRFDNTYVLDRYSKLKNVASMLGKTDDELRNERPDETKPYLGRMKCFRSEIKKQTFSSNQKGAHEKFKLLLPGRVVLDSYDIMKDQHNESSYKLDNLAEKYLGTKKIEQDYNEIPRMFGTKQGRHDLAVYCVKDSWLVRKMMDKLCKLTVLLQMSNVTGISMKDVIERGQGIRTMGLMLRYCGKRSPEYFVPRVIRDEKKVTLQVLDKKRKIQQIEADAEPETYEGAAVIDPIKGFYKDAVSCLDFASLYPSIMRALNMSYETMVKKETVDEMQWPQLTDKSPAKGVRTIPDYEYTNGRLEWTINRDNPTFVTSDVRKGLLPEMLEAVLGERKRVKGMMKALSDKTSTMYKVYDGRQLGLKVVANSMYGFTGANVGFLPEKKIASSVTKYGKFMLYQTKNAVENHDIWGKKGCKVIYGDTDSVFVHIPRCLVDGADETSLMENAHVFGEKMASEITDIFLPPNDLEYEKSYSSFLLLKKKRYAGHKFEPGHAPKLQIKGLEAARRDYAPLLVHTQKRMLNILLLERDIQKACDFVGKAVFDLMNGNTPVDMLVMSKKLSRPANKYKAIAAHVYLALRLMKESPEIAPVSGDRVDYVIYTSGSSKVSESACLPSEITSGKFSVDVQYYLEKQLKGPLMRILEKVVENPSQLFICNSIFKQSAQQGMMAAFLSGNRTSSSTNTFTSKKIKPKRTETERETIRRIFGKK